MEGIFSVSDLLSTLVSYDSTENNERSILEWLAWYLEKNGFTVQRLKLDDKRFNVYAYRGKQTSTNLMWYGHVDTVPVYQGWKTDPFKLVDKKDRYYGLGACDMKGGIAALLYAVTVSDRNVPAKILLCADEEYDSLGAWSVYKDHKEIFKGVEYLISMEPGASEHKVGGEDVITLGRRGRVRLEVKVRGVSAHGGHPERGINAIDIANQFIDQLLNRKLTIHPQLDKATHYIANIKGDSHGLSLPEESEFEIDRHLVMPDNVESALNEYKALAQEFLNRIKHEKGILADNVKIKVAVKKRKNDYMLPYVTKHDSFISKMEEVITKQKLKPFINYGRSVGDENIFALINSVKPIILGPEGGDIHSANEWVSKSSLDRISEIYSDLARISARS